MATVTGVPFCSNINPTHPSNLIPHCIIEDLLSTSFSSRTFTEKKDIILTGRVTPNIPKLQTKTKACVRYFKPEIYSKHKWLCGCDKVEKLFCWPCFLFSSEKGVWNRQGYNDMNNFHKASHRHEKTHGHLDSLIKLKKFGLARIDLQLDKQRRMDISFHNENVRKNRDILKRLIDVVCLLGKQELSFRGHNEGDSSINRGNYIEFINFISEYDETLSSHLKTSTVFSGLSNHIQNDIINSINNVMVNTIKYEVENSPFVAIMLDETTDISCKSQLSTVLRYVSNEGKVEERFIGFTDVSSDRSAEALSQLVFKCIDEYQCGGKLIAQTYDGAAVMAGEVSGLQSRIRVKYPNAMFVHCCAHRLNLVLSQSVSKIKECNVFFMTLGGFATFFSKSSKRIHALDEEVKKRFPKVAPTRWNYNGRLVNTVYENKNALKDLFRNILDNPDKWDKETFLCTRGFVNALQEFDFNFLLPIFSDLFSLTDILFEILQKKSCDIAYCRKKISEMELAISGKRRDFDKYWTSTIHNEGPPTKRQRVCDSGSMEDSYKRLFFEIFDNILEQLKFRFHNLDQLKFLELIDHNKRAHYNQFFPEDALNSLKVSYGNHFDFPSLRSELSAAFNLNDYDNKSAIEILQFLKMIELDVDGFPELYKLCALVATIPSTSASVERSFSALKRIKTYSRNTQLEERMSNLAMMSIEKKLLLHLKQQGNFYNDVINDFVKKTRRIELIYK